MATLPNGRRYNEFDPNDEAKIHQLAYTSAEQNKKYLDKELRPFLKGRTLILYGTAGGYNAGSGSLEVSVAGETGNLTLAALGCPKKRAKKLRGKAVRVLVDTRSKTVYFDDQAF